MLKVLQDSEKHSPKQHWLAGSMRHTMDKEEAENPGYMLIFFQATGRPAYDRLPSPGNTGGTIR